MPEKLVDSAWHPHAPFAFWVIDVHRPRTLVELGTYQGFSYLAFCQAVDRLDTGTRCYAIDHWSGDEYGGFYGQEVFQELSAYHDGRYGSFSELVPSTFDDAAPHFDDGSIDLLHIDGAHGLSDVKSDFERWLPKMSDRGVVLFHDINVHRDGFGVHVLWEELKADHPHFDFDHGHGLGVLGVGPKAADTLGDLFAAQADEERALEIRRAFSRLGFAVADLARLESGVAQLEVTDGRTTEELVRDLETSQRELEVTSSRLAGLQTRAAQDRSAVTALTTELDGARARIHALSEEIAALRSSTSWKVTAPLRWTMSGLRRLRRQASRAAKLVWWTVTLQLPRRLRAYRRYRRGDVDPQSTTQSREAERFTKPGPLYEEFSPPPPGRRPLAKLIAYYLPQFHAIPENDEWWGPGFTEWTNVVRGRPRFAGHYQPRTPGALGFYDLTDPKVLPRQVELATAAGIHAFCFYYYLFEEGPMLREPLDRFLSDPSLDMSFCIMWANENWTRTWDGYDREILRSFGYSADIERGWLDDLVRCFSDERYLRIDGRPVVIVYRPALIPDAANAFDRWRTHIRNELGVVPLILNAQCTEMDPGEFGLDGAVEFPPHKLGAGLAERRGEVEVLDPDYRGTIRSYAELVETARSEPVPPYPLVRTVSPFWDNDARRPNWGFTIAGSTPQLYEQWLDESIDFAIDHPLGSEPIVFVNAWNEWAEAAYLEPDVHYGWAYLNATARALHRPRALRDRRKVLLVGHDATPNGSQLLLLSLGRIFTRQFGVDVEFLLLEGGELLDRYREVAPVRVLGPHDPGFDGHVAILASRGFSRAISSTVVTGPALESLKAAGFAVTALVHELGGTIDERGWSDAAREIAAHADTVVFASDFVADRFTEGIPPDRVLVLPQGLYQPIAGAADDHGARTAVRAELGIDHDTPIVLGVGSAELHKGFDLFVESAGKAPDLAFVWLGHVDTKLHHWMVDEAPRRANNLFVLDFSPEVSRYYAAADVFYLPSREDSFPSTVLEALAAGLPVVAFSGSTGSADLIARTGRLVEPFDLEAAIEALRDSARLGPAVDKAAADQRREIVEREFRLDDYAFALLRHLFPEVQAVSVVVPTYNYGRYLDQRLRSIFDQTHPVFEVIVLDDASTDDTAAVLDRVIAETGRDIRIVTSGTNSGSVMHQWRKGAEMARADLVWIAEADDASRPAYLERLTAEFATEDPPVFAYSDSAQIDEEGEHLADSYRYYLDEGTDGRFRTDFRMDGREFLETLLSVRNVVLNASSVTFRRDPLLKVLSELSDELESYRFAGDWRAYAALCELGDVAFVATPLNINRRHTTSTSLGTSVDDHVAEIMRVHEYLRATVDDGSLSQRQQEYIDTVIDHLRG
ncbi:MAG TPA: glycoside hydrolase family 99-like domain-containing protein [Acidimicrobiia bacterium]|nr:glycoside hydrolase family 99-like domain-containing protein [Acidimicrobiia bacterium]